MADRARPHALSEEIPNDASGRTVTPDNERGEFKDNQEVFHRPRAT
jgi:hypothetical protein